VWTASDNYAETFNRTTGTSNLIALRNVTKPSSSLSLWLDAFRGVAAVAVVMGHAHALLLKGTAPGSGLVLRLCAALAYFLSAWSHQAVVVFFVMSGYLVGGPFLVKFFKGEASASDYTAARVSRMYTVLVPALILTLVLDFISLRYFHGQLFIDTRPDFFPHRPNLLDQLGPAGFVCNSLFLQGIACAQYGSNLSLWSLSNEALYYGVGLALIMSPTGAAYRLALVALVALVFYPYFIPGSQPRAIVYGAYFLVWVAGAMTSATVPIGKWAATFGFIASVSIWGIAAKLTGQNLGSDLILAVAFIALITSIDAWNIGFPLYHRPVKALAGISYSLYAIHLPILVFILASLGFDRRLPAGWFPLALLGSMTIFCIGCAAVFWWLFERHTRHVKKFMTRVLRKRPIGGAATIEIR
jgi:peptidoglycan/LPS O-acetylase OafA/YrhL